jgi:hypothetical protein
MIIRRATRRFSTYFALAIWGAAAFMAQPTIASLVVHFTVLPLFIILTIWTSHREGRKDIK